MDEVDGLSGNDRGGVGALINIIKKTLVPIICIANDSKHKKLQSLMNHCYDLKFAKPGLSDILKRVKVLAEQENMQYDPMAVEKCAELSQYDIRAIINMLQMHMTNHKILNTYDINRKQMNIQKD
jgi:replication factor C subunit 1